MNITPVGIDLAKYVFQVHGVDERGKVGVAQATEARAGGELLRSTAAVPDRDGGLRQRALLGAQTHGARAHGEADGAAVCEAVRQDQ